MPGLVCFPKKMGRLSVFLFGAVLVGVVSSNTVNLRSLCNSQLTCTECITSNPGCVWCAAANFSMSRCYGYDDTESNCPEPVQNPMGEEPVLTAAEFKDFNQISPSTAFVQVRPLLSSNFTLTVKPASNFPIDMYLLMDLSFSMLDDLHNLKILGNTLVDHIRSLSTNFRIGFGSFVDKNLGPYIRHNPYIKDNPCPTNPTPCVPTYSFRHTISLTSNTLKFERLLRAQEISGNYDPPEGGFDGFLQSLLCTDLIGWRRRSRKLILFITDSGFHFAGDGKLGGVIKPYKSVCRMPSSIPSGQNYVQYDGAITYDYPSIGQIARALRDEDIIPIFAVTKNVQNIYESLAAEIGEGALVGTLDQNSMNVVTLVVNLYNTISQRVIFEQEQVPGVTVTVKALTCPSGFIVDGICNGLQVDTPATFSVSVLVSQCTPQLMNGKEIVTVRAIGFGTFDVVVNATCQCGCQNFKGVNSTSCSGNGTFSCGHCVCNPGNFGETCQCDASNQGASSSLICPLGSNNLQCSGRGSCACGLCNCQDGFFGTVCECDERDCNSLDLGLVCSGRGSCRCNGQCTCNVEPVTGQPYSGELNVCECTPNQQNCRDPTNRTSICNGRGECGCDGTCMCNNPYFGDFCELCSGSDVCFDSNCESNRDCANCILDIVAPVLDIVTVDQYFMIDNVETMLPNGSALSLNSINNANQISLPASVCPVCSSGAVIINGTDRIEYEIGDESAVRCEEVRQACVHRYFVAIGGDTNDFTAVHVEYTRSCSESRVGTAPWIIAIGIIIPLLVLGLLALILFKALLLICDYIEVQKFEKELSQTKYSKNENPLYQSAAKDYKNPLYGQ